MQLEIGKTTSLEVKLDVGQMTEEVTVTAESPMVDTSSKEIGGTITARSLVDLPSVNRNDVIGQRAGMQARPAVEAIQEFQVLTSQFDAEFGRTTGAVINAVTKQGTNDFHGSAFGFFQGSGLTNRDFFVKENDLVKPDTSERQWGGTVGGPVVRDEGPRLEHVRPGDHQINASNQYNVHWMREQSPQLNQIIGRVTQAASREESDVDQNLVANLNTVVGNTKLNTARFGFTRENVAFANPCFNGNGRRQDQCDPTLVYLTFTDQQSTVAQARINNGWQLEDTFSASSRSPPTGCSIRTIPRPIPNGWPSAVFYDKTHFEEITALLTSGVFSHSFLAQFPANQADPGPSNGQLPTDPLLVNGPTVNVDLLNAMFPPGSQVKNAGTVFVDNPDRRLPDTQQFTVGFERQLGTGLSASADYVHSRERGLFMSRDLNPGVRVDTSRTGRIDRVDPAFTQVRVHARERGPDRLRRPRAAGGAPQRDVPGTGVLHAGALEWQHGGRLPASAALPVPRRLEPGRGTEPGSDRLLPRHNLVLSGAAVLPRTHGVTFSWVARYLSGAPFTVMDTSADTNRNGVLLDPLPSGDYSGEGPDAITVHSDGHRNGATGPNFFQLDVRLGYKLRPGGNRTLDLFAEIFNLTDRANFDLTSPNAALGTGDRRSSNFLVPTDLRSGANPRTAQIGIRLGF